MAVGWEKYRKCTIKFLFYIMLYSCVPIYLHIENLTTKYIMFIYLKARSFPPRYFHYYIIGGLRGIEGAIRPRRARRELSRSAGTITPSLIFGRYQFLTPSIILILLRIRFYYTAQFFGFFIYRSILGIQKFYNF